MKQSTQIRKLMESYIQRYGMTRVDTPLENSGHLIIMPRNSLGPGYVQVRLETGEVWVGHFSIKYINRLCTPKQRPPVPH